MLQAIIDPTAADAVMRVVAERWAELAVKLCASIVDYDNPYDLLRDDRVKRDNQIRQDDIECNALAKAIEQLTGYPTPPVQVRDFIYKPVGTHLKAYHPVGGDAERKRLRRLVCDRAKIAE